MIRLVLMCPLAAFAIALMCGVASPAAACDASFPPSVEVGTQALILNGWGWRVVSPWGIRAYAAALYQPSRTTDQTEALNLGRPWAVEMIYCRRASAADIREVWLKSLQQNCVSGCALYPGPTHSFLATLDDALSEARWRFTFDGRTLEVRSSDVARGTIADPAFAGTLLSTWIGAAPPTVELRAALLGRH